MKSKYIILVLTSLFCVGCDSFLTYNERSFVEKSDAFAEFSKATQLLSGVYNILPSGFSDVGDAMLESATDNGMCVWNSSSAANTSNIQNFYNGSWSPIIAVDGQWANFYKGIRRANLFLENVNDSIILDEYKWSGDNYQSMKKRWAFYRYEARFLRAFYHFELAKRYGDIPIVDHTLTVDEANNTPRNSFEDVIRWIVSECEDIAPNLPISYTNADITPNLETGRATWGAAMALRSRALLYLASPLHNPSSDPDYSAKWLAAAAAADDVIKSGVYKNALPAWDNVFNNSGTATPWDATANTELILERRQADDHAFEMANTSIGFEGGNTTNCPTQNLVDCYEMQTTGKGILEDGSGYNPANPYVGRDPRLAMTVLYNGATWKTRAMQCYYGGLDASPNAGVSPTGYYLRKGLAQSTVISGANMTNTKHSWMLFRYTEILLNYAEAMNEVYGPNDKGPFTFSATEAVNFVRQRTGVAMPPFPATLSQEEFRAKIHNERRVEFAFEGHRMWDMRRLKEGDLTRTIYGMDIVLDSGVTTYTPQQIRTRIWDDKMYYYPIPQSEIYDTHNVLTQNPGWGN